MLLRSFSLNPNCHLKPVLSFSNQGEDEDDDENEDTFGYTPLNGSALLENSTFDIFPLPA